MKEVFLQTCDKCGTVQFKYHKVSKVEVNVYYCLVCDSAEFFYSIEVIDNKIYIHK